MRRPGQLLEECVEVELEAGDPAAELANHAGGDLGLAGARHAEGRRHAQRPEQRLDRALRVRECLLAGVGPNGPGRMPVLLRELALARQVDARDLEERRVLVPERVVRAHRGRDLGQELGAEHRLVGRRRLGQAQRGRVRVAPDEAGRVRLGEPRADEDVLDRPAESLRRGEHAEHGPAPRQRERNVVELEPRDLLDQVDLARDVARAPGRSGHGSGRPGSNPSRRRIESCSRVRHLEPDERRGPVGAEADHRRARQVRPHVRLPGPAGTGRLRDEPRAEARRRRGEVRVDALLPAVRALGPQAQAPRRGEDPDRLEVRGLEQHVFRPLGDLRLLAAHDRRDGHGPLHRPRSRGPRRGSRFCPSSVVIVSPGRA